PLQPVALKTQLQGRWFDWPASPRKTLKSRGLTARNETVRCATFAADAGRNTGREESKSNGSIASGRNLRGLTQRNNQSKVPLLPGAKATRQTPTAQRIGDAL